MDEVNNFLKRFHLSSNVDEVFTCGCCYWFAAILFRRFIRDGAEIVYSVEDNHFGTKIRGKVYDITGNVTTKYDWVSWLNYSDSTHKERIIRDCIMF